ncbi:hypothetical protein HMPREF0731_1535 [Pseudoroseomonas cervicalis ATCC 49957]|uniref:Uncharacterized protein n=1 Tax=Pseudoroseomonas cervicalis ATCC 49957 TaxID=525371 RepID=D5RKC5_9PROT|nr:hypothetical protein HMPREF0731_1535 [Pseudoroseomonas cervicalis ATCC 49957]
MAPQQGRGLLAIRAMGERRAQRLPQAGLLLQVPRQALPFRHAHRSLLARGRAAPWGRPDGVVRQDSTAAPPERLRGFSISGLRVSARQACSIPWADENGVVPINGTIFARNCRSSALRRPPPRL